MSEAAPDVKLSGEDRARLRKLIEQYGGIAGVAKVLKVSRSVLASAAAGIAVRPGSIALLRGALANYSNGSNGSSR